MTPHEVHVYVWDWPWLDSWWNRNAPRRQQLKWTIEPSLVQELAVNLAREHFSQKRGHRIAQLLLDGAEIADDPNAIGERLQPAKLAHGKPAILPVKRTSCRTRLGLNRPGWPILCELQKKRPVVPSPTEEREASSAVGVEEIVFALRDRG